MSDGCLFDIGASDRSWTDVLTNSTHIHPLDAWVEPADILDGRVPIGAIPALLHETSHHAALQTPVGITLALLELRASRLIGSGDKQASQEAETLVLAVRAVLETYRPLLEGLALFTEFDTVPGHGRIQSTAHNAVVRHAVRHRHKEDPETHWESHLFGVLSDSRLTRGSIERRENVLARPFTDPDGYLLGYSYVKTWQRYASRKTPLLRDTDLATFFLIEYFFSDYDLVARLLNRSNDPVHDLLEYCRNRLVSLAAKSNWSSEVEEFEEATYCSKIDLDTITDFELHPRPPEHSPDVGTHDQLEAALRNAHPEDIAVLARRSLLHLMSLPVGVTRTRARGDHLIATFRDVPVVIVPTDSSYTGEGGTGTLDIVDDTASRNSAVVLCVDGKVIHVTVHDGRDNYMARWLRQFDTSSRTSPHASMTRLREELGEDFTVRYASFRDVVRSERFAAYEPLALAWAAKGARQDIIDNPHGIGGLLGSDLTYALAVLSSIDVNEARLEEAVLMEGPALDLAQAVEAINERLAPYGFRGVTLRKGNDGTSMRTFL